MSDKAFILLLIVLISMGIFSYQKALEERGGVIPMQEYLEEKIKVDSEGKFWSKKVDTLNLQQSIKSFRSELEDLALKKDSLLQAREASLEALLQANRRIHRVAIDHLNAILEIYQQYQDPYDAFKQAGKDILALSESADDLEKRQRVYPKKSTELHTAIDSITGERREEALINDRLVRTDQLMTSAFDPAQQDCKELKACIADNLHDIELEVNAFLDARIVRTLRALEDIIKLNLILEHEYKFLSLNSLGTNEKVEENNRILEEGLNDSLEGLSDLTYKELGVLVKLVHLSRLELDAAIFNLEEHHAHFEKRFKESMEVQEAIVKQLEKSTYFTFSDLTMSFQEEKPYIADNYNKIRADAPLLVELLTKDIEADERIIQAVANHLSIDLTALREELGLTEMTAVANLDGEALLDGGVLKPKDPTAVADANREQMQIMREKAERDEQTLKKMYEIYGAPR